MRITTIIAKTAGLIGKTVLIAGLWELEPTPEPAPWQKAAVYGQKAGVYEQNPPPFATNLGGGSGKCRKKVGVVAYTPKEKYAKIWKQLTIAISL